MGRQSLTHVAAETRLEMLLIYRLDQVRSKFQQHNSQTCTEIKVPCVRQPICPALTSVSFPLAYFWCQCLQKQSVLFGPVSPAEASFLLRVNYHQHTDLQPAGKHLTPAFSCFCQEAETSYFDSEHPFFHSLELRLYSSGIFQPDCQQIKALASCSLMRTLWYSMFSISEAAGGLWAAHSCSNLNTSLHSNDQTGYLIWSEAGVDLVIG